MSSTQQEPRFDTRVELLTLEADDGMPLDGALYRPCGERRAGTGVALFHGGVGEFYLPLFRALGRGLAARGWPVLSLNRRDHGANFGSVTLQRGAMDQRAAVDHLESLGAERVILGGHSYGTVTVPWYVANTDDPRVAGMLLYAALGDLARASVIICGGQERYDAYVEQCRAAVAAGHGDEAFVMPPMVEGMLPMTHTRAVFLDIRGPGAVTTDALIRQAGDRPILALRHARDPFPGTLPPTRERLEAASPNLSYVLVGSEGPMARETHRFAGHEDEILLLTVRWLSEHGFTP
jgi:pimeloyl-ACP methyl ester carboxylesterase